MTKTMTKAVTKTMTRPRHGGQLRAIATQFNIPAKELLDFSANINPDGPPEAVRLALRRAIDDGSALALYPELDERSLRETISKSLGLHVETIFVGNGFVPLLRATVEALDLRRCLLPVPCFNEYRRTLELAGVDVVPSPLQASEEFAYDATIILDAVRRHGCDCLLLANPQNPSGVLCDRASILHLVERSAVVGVRVLVDEAFIDYALDESVTASAAMFENLIVFRSLTKFYALPGLRVAYGVAPIGIADRVQNRIAPWSITTLASLGVVAALGDLPFAAEARRNNLARRTMLAAGLATIGSSASESATAMRVFAGRANFLLFHAPPGVDLWQRMIVDQKIVLRDCGTYEGLGVGFYRAAVRDERDNQRLIEALRTTL